MYLQITTRCNMSCAHCGFDCTPQGEDMPMEVFRAALPHLDEGLTIGGGEPTLHPQFEVILLECIAQVAQWGEYGPHIVTNGKITSRAMMIAALTKGGVISGELSRDEYHDPIEWGVVQAFEGVTTLGGAVRDTSAGGSREPLPHGRGAELMGYDAENPPELDGSECLCPTALIKPNGDVHQCGCPDSPIIGNVFDGWYSPYSGECCHSPDFINTCLEEGYEDLLPQ